MWRRRGRARLRTPIAIARRRIATGLGAVGLSLAALAFAFAGDVAQRSFARIVAAYPYLPLLLSPALFAATAFATARWAPAARGSGIPQVMAAGRDPAVSANGPLVSIRTALAQFAFMVGVLFAGGSAGREGPTVQISAVIMLAVHRMLRVPVTAGVMIAGGAAGVAAAFYTPLAGVAFAIEELAAAYEQRVALLVMGAVMISGLTSLGLAGDYVYFGVAHARLQLQAMLFLPLLVGVVAGVLGGGFARVLLAVSAGRHRWIRPLKRYPVRSATACGLVVAVLGIASGGATWGTGYETTRMMVEGHSASWWFAPAKLAATLATSTSGTPGGIFAPSLAVGAGVGDLLARLAPDQPAGAVVLLGMAAYFVGVVRAPLTAVIILTETTASRAMILPLFVTALIAEASSALVCPERLYHGLARAFLPNKGDGAGRHG